MRFANLSLRLRLFLLILSPLLVASVLLGIWRYQVARDTSDLLFDRGLLAAALAISRDVAISEGDALSPATRSVISDAGGGEVFYHVTGPGGIYVTGYAYPPSWRVPDAVDGRPQYAVATYRGEPVRILRMSETTTIDNLTGQTVVTVWQRMSDRYAFARQLSYRAAVLIGALMATLAVVVWFGVQRGLSPLRGLRDAIERRSPDDLTPIRRPVPSEVRGVVATLNRLFGQVQDSIQAHQAFISDAAHQLRNPAAALLSLAETLPHARDPEERHRRQQELIAAARRSATLAEKLLSMERLRYGGMSGRQAIDLNAVAEEAASDLAPLILSRDLALSFDAAGPLPVMADPVLVGEAIRNLIDNAIQHGGPTMTAIAVTLSRTGDAARVTVSDDGRGLSPEDLELAFRRFGQVRSGQGSGLGLSIVRQVAEAHGGQVDARASEGGGCFSLTLPLAGRSSPYPDGRSGNP
ncbi:sensor histidine kinase [Paracoccus zeaxanthinifaciens]|uniref:sensor histidine kinase n=1 Tax=Paracoccus zeaxanthinifaciens TaxID=187400 RepID=UPI0003B54B87|nr:sensor histidine kinase [Paracoccus zeaxanthinifaciens]